MQNEKFKHALAAALIPEYENSIPQTEAHKFSPEFEKKMERLIRRQRKPYFKLINTAGKRAACIAVCFITSISVTSLQSDAVREGLLNFFINSDSKGSVFTVESDTDAPSTIEDIYAITYDLSDYKIYFEEYDVTRRNITYQKGDVNIHFSQYTKERYNNIGLNTEGASIETIKINGYDAIYFCNHIGIHYIIWDNGDYVLEIFSTVGKDVLIEIAESVQKVE